MNITDDKKLLNAKYNEDIIRGFGTFPEVKSVKVCQDGVIITVNTTKKDKGLKNESSN